MMLHTFIMAEIYEQTLKNTDMTRDQAIQAQTGSPAPYPVFNPQSKSGNFGDNHLYIAELILCTIAASTAIIAICTLLSYCIMTVLGIPLT